jgi:hypothetical protein
MRILRKIKTMLTMPSSNKFLFVEALYTTAYVRFTLSFLPFKIVNGWLGKANAEVDLAATLLPEQIQYIKDVHHAIKLADKYAIWKTECYTQALTGKILLRKRNIPSTLFIGFKKENDKYEGHAWLKTARGIITGNMNLAQFQVNAFFS